MEEGYSLTCYLTCSLGLLSGPASYIGQTHLPREGDTHNGLGPPTSAINLDSLS